MESWEKFKYVTSGQRERIQNQVKIRSKNVKNQEKGLFRMDTANTCLFLECRRQRSEGG